MTLSRLEFSWDAWAKFFWRISVNYARVIWSRIPKIEYIRISISIIETKGDVELLAVACRCRTRWSSRTMQHCPCISWLRTRTKHTASTTRLCTTSASVPWSWQRRPTVTSTTSSQPPCLVLPPASASRDRSHHFTNRFHETFHSNHQISSYSVAVPHIQE